MFSLHGHSIAISISTGVADMVTVKNNISLYYYSSTSFSFLSVNYGLKKKKPAEMLFIARLILGPSLSLN